MGTCRVCPDWQSHYLRNTTVLYHDTKQLWLGQSSSCTELAQGLRQKSDDPLVPSPALQYNKYVLLEGCMQLYLP
jgi:hypothetical protein